MALDGVALLVCIHLDSSALICTYRQLVCTYRQLVCTYRQLVCISLHLSALVCTYRQIVCTYRQIVCTYRQIVCTYRHYCGILWRHVGSLSVDKGASCNTRFGACFWGTYFGGSSQSILGHPEPFYEGLYRPLLAQVLWWPWMVLRFLFAFIWIHLH